MQRLWRKTADLFLKHPVIWLPYLGAHLLASGLTWLRTFASRRIIDWCPTLHSVLGAAYQNCGTETWGLKLTLVRLLRAGFEYADHCIFTVELILIAILVGATLRGQKPAFKTMAGVLRPYLGRILMYSLKIWFLSLVLAALIYAPSYLEGFSKHFGARWMAFVFTTAQAMLSLVCYTWIMVPLAIALLRPVGECAVSVEEKKQGRAFCILAGVAAYAMQSLLLPLLMLIPIIDSNAVRPIALSIFVPVISCPNLLGDIALVLLASREDWRSAEIKPVLDIRKLLSGLMPLHFGPGDEPVGPTSGRSSPSLPAESSES